MSREKKFMYKTNLRWEGGKRGGLLIKNKNKILISTPPEFGGEEGFWSPEELLISSVNSCIMTTFLHYADRKGLEVTSYESSVEGVLENVEKQFRFSSITVKPKIVVKNKDQISEIRALLGVAEKHCFISNSVKSEVEIVPEIE